MIGRLQPVQSGRTVLLLLCTVALLALQMPQIRSNEEIRVLSFYDESITVDNTRSQVHSKLTLSQHEQRQSFNFESLGCGAEDKSPTPGRCGKTKCFFVLANNSSIGYAVSGTTPYIQDVMHRGWEYSLYLEKNYGIPRVPIEAPRIETNVSTEFAACLDAKRGRMEGSEEEYSIPKFGKGRRDRNTKTGKHYDHTNGLLVQKNRVIPEPNIVLKPCQSNERIEEAVSIPRFWKSVESCEMYLRNLEHEGERAKLVLENERSLRRDFQVIIDTTGRFHYIDLGHHVTNNELPTHTNKTDEERGKYILHCMESLDYLVQLSADICDQYGGIRNA